jgi:hypothetical protein
MKKKAKAKVKGKAKTSRKRSAAKDLSAKKAGAVKGGLLPASTALPAVQQGYKIAAGDGSVRLADKIVKL